MSQCSSFICHCKEWAHICQGMSPSIIRNILSSHPAPMQPHRTCHANASIRAMSTGLIQNYWNKTETYEALAEYIRKDFDGLKEAVAVLMDGGRIRIDISGYQNDMTTFHNRDDVMSLLIHLGYLGYDDENSEAFIPNREILDEFRTSTRSEEWMPKFKSFELSQELLRATWEQNADKVAEILEELLYEKEVI